MFVAADDCSHWLSPRAAAVSYRLDTTLAKKDGAHQTDSPPSALPKATAEMPAEGDVAIARAP
jgi:hypothetical protein